MPLPPRPPPQHNFAIPPKREAQRDSLRYLETVDAIATAIPHSAIGGVPKVGSLLQEPTEIGKFCTGSVQMGSDWNFPFYAANCSRSPLSSERIREKRRKTKKRKTNKKPQKTRRKEKGKFHPTPSTPTPLRTSKENRRWAFVPLGLSAQVHPLVDDTPSKDLLERGRKRKLRRHENHAERLSRFCVFQRRPKGT